MTKIARTPPSSSTGDRTRGPGLPVSKDAVNASWQIGILFSHICYEKKCAMKSKNPHRQQSTTLPCWWRYPVLSYQHKSTALPLSLSTRLSGNKVIQGQYCHLAILVSLQSLFTKEPVNIQGRNQLWVGGEDALQGGFFALLDREVTRLLNHARSLQNNQVLENNKGEESDGIY